MLKIVPCEPALRKVKQCIYCQRLQIHKIQQCTRMNLILSEARNLADDK